MTDFNISVFQNVFRGVYIATLIECEFSNCHGVGKTESEAIANLKSRATARAKLAWAKAEAKFHEAEIAELEKDND